MTRWLTVCVLSVLAVGAWAKDRPGDGGIAEAEALARKGEVLAAARRFGEALTSAQTAGDLVLEGDVTRAFVRFVGRLPERSKAPVAPGTTHDERPPTQGAALAETMRNLPSKRLGGFAAAPLLARDVLLLATDTGDRTDVADAASIAKAAAQVTKSGHAFDVTAQYAEGMVLVDAGKFADATKPLAVASKAAAEQGWIDLATHAAVELAYAWWKLDDAEQAAAALADVASTCDATTSYHGLSRWKACLAVRLDGAPDAIRAAADPAFALLDSPPQFGELQGAGSGAPGRNAGEPDPVSSVGALLANRKGGKSLASVSRTPKGLAVAWPWKSGKPEVQPPSIGESFVVEGGLTLNLGDRAVALHKIDLRGLDGRDGDNPQPQPGRADYLLATGETWALLRDGTVTIGK